MTTAARYRDLPGYDGKVQIGWLLWGLVLLSPDEGWTTIQPLGEIPWKGKLGNRKEHMEKVYKIYAVVFKDEYHGNTLTDWQYLKRKPEETAKATQICRWNFPNTFVLRRLRLKPDGSLCNPEEEVFGYPCWEPYHRLRANNKRNLVYLGKIHRYNFDTLRANTFAHDHPTQNRLDAHDWNWKIPVNAVGTPICSNVRIALTMNGGITMLSIQPFKVYNLHAQSRVMLQHTEYHVADLFVQTFGKAWVENTQGHWKAIAGTFGRLQVCRDAPINTFTIRKWKSADRGLKRMKMDELSSSESGYWKYIVQVDPIKPTRLRFHDHTSLQRSVHRQVSLARLRLETFGEEGRQDELDVIHVDGNTMNQHYSNVRWDHNKT